jgi:hypothetical protein
MTVDMSPRAITTRLKRVAQLRKAYLRLAKGQLTPREPSLPAALDAKEDTIAAPAATRSSEREET